VPVIAFLGYVSYVRLRVGCPICMGTYACVIAILALTSGTHGVPLRDLPGRAGQDLAAVLRRGGVVLLALILFGGVTAAAVLFPREGSAGAAAAAAPAPSADVQSQFAAAWAKQPRIDLGIPADGAKVLVVKFNDYECSTCRMAEATYDPIFEKFARTNPGAVKVVFKDWAWNNTCNSFSPGTIPGHEASCVAAVAARLAREHGQYDAMKTWLFANQGLSPEAVQAHAVQALGLSDFAAEARRVMPAIQQDFADGHALEIAATPTYFINGVRLPSDSLIAPEYFEMAIALELKRAD
jgi:protein-disulfide isomerase